MVDFLVGFVQTAAPHQQFLDFWSDLDDIVSDIVHPRYRISTKWAKKITKAYRNTKKLVRFYNNDEDCGSTHENVKMHVFDEIKTPGENIGLLAEMIDNWIQEAF